MLIVHFYSFFMLPAAEADAKQTATPLKVRILI